MEPSYGPPVIPIVELTEYQTISILRALPSRGGTPNQA